MKQTERVLRYIEEHGSITPSESFTKLGVMRLAARINDLRAEGHNIETISAKHEGGYHARYVLHPPIAVGQIQLPLSDDEPVPITARHRRDGMVPSAASRLR